MELTPNEKAVLKEQYQKIIEQIAEQGFVNQLLGADVIQRLANLAIARVAFENGKTGKR